MKESDHPTSSGSNNEAKVIKRYSNRKLYDTVESRYVTLDEIAGMIKRGLEVKVIDNRSKEDLTSVTLAQIIFEEEKKKNQMPLALLREIIRRPGESISVFIQKELTPRVTSIREGAESRLDKLFRREDQLEGTSAADLLKSSQKTLEEWQGKIDERIRQGIENLVGTFPVLGRDIHSVRQKLEELEKKIDELERKP
ncbi:MAG TPA: polyhydroxyalkanoate synthesis regulator DNA-binding domain-containing protein [Myxococcales bacterium]